METSFDRLRVVSVRRWLHVHTAFRLFKDFIPFGRGRELQDTPPAVLAALQRFGFELVTLENGEQAFTYMHYGIEAIDPNGISHFFHFTGGEPGVVGDFDKVSAAFQETDGAVFLNGGLLIAVDDFISDQDAVIQACKRLELAQTRFVKGTYNLLMANCEHVANFVATGSMVSKQIYDTAADVLQSEGFTDASRAVREWTAGMNRQFVDISQLVTSFAKQNWMTITGIAVASAMGFALFRSKRKQSNNKS
eukprot:GILJ01003161.1.p1 GENE.GILJ01003161.1~~GILJ01003161.1.p1  ORF type:complete len:270 (+),score=39.51 GILJ01003161.1:61-810(+)